MTDELNRLDATAQAELVRKKEVSPRELVDAAIARIERVNPSLNAVIRPLFDEARAAAGGHLPDGPFRGVPILIKDVFGSVKGVAHTFGSRALANYVADHDSEEIARLKRAGFVIVGKTNAPEFGIVPTTEPALFGPTRNPWDRARSPGGSSGGSAAAVAAGMTAVAHANDGGGSIRIPASCCGVFGLKPTRGRNTLAPDLGDVMSGLVAEHAVTRSVRDSAAVLDATAGPAPGDPYFAPPPARPFRDEVGAPPGRLRIALSVTAATGAPTHPDCVAAAREAAALCELLGHHVVEAVPTVDPFMLSEAFLGVWSAGAAATLESVRYLRGTPVKEEEVEPLTWALAEAGRRVNAAQYLMAVTFLQMVSRAVARFMADYDVLLTPTAAEPPPVLGSFDALPGNPMAGLFRAAAFVPFTPMANFTGQPAMSVPLHWSADGLPIGAHFTGRYGDEATLFRLAAQLEEARPWRDRWPKL